MSITRKREKGRLSLGERVEVLQKIPFWFSILLSVQLPLLRGNTQPEGVISHIHSYNQSSPQAGLVEEGVVPSQGAAPWVLRKWGATRQVPSKGFPTLTSTSSFPSCGIHKSYWEHLSLRQTPRRQEVAAFLLR